MEDQINKYFDLAEYLLDKIKERKNFEVVLDKPEFTNICFWYVPNSIKDLDRNSKEFKERLNKVAPKIKERMVIEGNLMISYQPLDDKPNFFRMIVSNPASNFEDIDYMINEIERFGNDL
ncbi:unnamed protein product [Brachionus calyciflorus]|uniref:Uncharacterized protein n=1 Tax=Brachionus calyciflorus TaxID=104777 RepID=A0A814QTY7_9BILA|nr:unnamed protein product [Brachionus calyciflorus]